MSRIGKKPIKIPLQTEISLSHGELSVKGIKGSLFLKVRPEISFLIEPHEILIKPSYINKQTMALWGTYASHLKNMINGVNSGFEKKIILEGVGYKSEVKGNDLVMALGFSHPVKVSIPEGIIVTAEKNLITVKGINKELVGQFTAKIRDLKKPEPYKGKGFRYHDEVIRRKQGKKTL